MSDVRDMLIWELSHLAAEIRVLPYADQRRRADNTMDRLKTEVMNNE